MEFYARTLALSIWFSKPGLTCFRFGQSYLMIEHGGVAADPVHILQGDHDPLVMGNVDADQTGHA